MSRIANAAPMAILNGIEDLSTRRVTAVAEELPQHLPKVFLFTKKGPTTPQLVFGASRTLMYDADSFDYRLPWANHQTVLSNTINNAGNAQIIQRLVPSDANPPASIRLCLDVLPTLVPEYSRNTDGSIKRDATGDPITTGVTIAGYKAKWVIEQVGITNGESDFGLADKKTGDQINTDTSTQSIRYPIADIEVPYFGGDGNNYGLRMWAPTVNSNVSIDSTILEDIKAMAYPLRMAAVYRETETSTPKIVPTLYAEQYVDVCLKPNVINKRVEKQVYAGDVFIQAYQDLQSKVYAPTFGPFGKMHLYDANISKLLNDFYIAEKPYIDSFSDLKNVVGEQYRFNFISGMNSSGSPYHSFIINYADTNAVRLSETSTIYAKGGSDGTMDNTMFDTLVSEAVEDYSNPLSLLQDTARHPESIIYDSGFDLDTKYALCNFIALRKDTAVVLCTHQDGKPVLSASEESSLAIALRTRLQMFPESDFYGTPVVRGLIMGRSGKLLSSQYTKELPVVIEVASKAAKYMGAGNGQWKSGNNFDGAPGNKIEMFTNINVTFTPKTVRNKDWDAGLNWVESYDLHSDSIPALKTVYTDDTSVLTSFTTMLACCKLQKIGEAAWRDFSGKDSLTDDQLTEQVNEFVSDKVKNIFDDRYVIIPETYFTNSDKQSGYRWSLRIKIYAPNMRTVMTLAVQASRLDDLTSNV